MVFNWKKFISRHSTVIVLLIYNIIILFIFTILYYLCEINFSYSFYKEGEPKPSYIIDHFLLSVSIQSGVGLASIIPSNNISKLLVATQQFFVMTSNAIILYLFIIISKGLFKL